MWMRLPRLNWRVALHKSRGPGTSIELWVSDGPKVRFEGGAGIENLKTVDRRNSEVLYSLKSFSVQGLALES